MQTAANNQYQGMLQRLSQLASGQPSAVPVAAMPQAPLPGGYPVAVPVMAPDQLALSQTAQTAVYAPAPYVVYPAPPVYAGYPTYPQATVPAPVPVSAPAPAANGNPLGIEWVGASTTASPSSATPSASLGVVWSGTSTAVPAPASNNPLGVDWATAPAPAAPVPADPTPAAPAPSPQPGGTYTVQSGDTLAKIAQATLGDANRWREIFELNRDQISDPSLIRPGQSLRLPGGANAAPAAPSTGSPGSEVGARAVSEAHKYLGVPYVWGGATPKGFDCSGLMQYVFRSIGVSIPRVAADQFRAGREVSRNDLQPGDAVFFKNTGSRTGITHVGMYIGNGKFLHAPKTGDVVKISNLGEAYYQSHYAGAKRYS
jgi:cell wall-associated NlpC family hydrolase